MKHFSLNLEAISPLAIRSDHAEISANTATSISGMALAGSLATVYRLYYPDASRDFEELFLSGQVQYPDLYPAMFRPIGMHNATKFPVYPLPKTAQSCKRFSGFSEAQGDISDDDDKPHGVRDSLLDWATFELARLAQQKGVAIDTPTLLAPLQEHKKCTVCNNPMAYISGFYRYDPANGQMAKASDETRLQMHTGINRATGTVQEGILYNRLVFVEHTRFWGLMKLPEQLASRFQAFIEEIGQTGLVRIGTGRTRGMGKINLKVEPLEKELEYENEQDWFEQFKQRLRTFNVTLHTRMKEAFPANADNLAPQPFYFALTLHSPVILCDDMLRFYGSIETSVLAKYLPLLAENLELIYQAASTRRISGWNELWGLPRVNEYAIDTGSVFLFGSHIAPDEEKDNALWQALFTLEEEGLGRRRGEGFGRVSVSDPFHSEAVLK